jgi:urease accessory protein
MSAGLLALLQLCDTLFPTGGFAHSDGLETATDRGLIRTTDDLRAWMDVVLHDTLGQAEGPAVLIAWDAAASGNRAGLLDLDAEVHALRPSSAARRATRAMGRRLLTTWGRVQPAAPAAWIAEAVAQERLATFPVAFGIACASAGIEGRQAVEGFLYTRLASTTSAAMRLLPIGQLEAQALLASLLRGAPGAADAIVERASRGGRPASFTPALDIAAMGHQYVHSRLFLS